MYTQYHPVYTQHLPPPPTPLQPPQAQSSSAHGLPRIRFSSSYWIPSLIEEQAGTPSSSITCLVSMARWERAGGGAVRAGMANKRQDGPATPVEIVLITVLEKSSFRGEKTSCPATLPNAVHKRSPPTTPTAITAPGHNPVKHLLNRPPFDGLDLAQGLERLEVAAGGVQHVVRPASGALARVVALLVA